MSYCSLCPCQDDCTEFAFPKLQYLAIRSVLFWSIKVKICYCYHSCYGHICVIQSAASDRVAADYVSDLCECVCNHFLQATFKN